VQPKQGLEKDRKGKRCALPLYSDKKKLHSADENLNAILVVINEPGSDPKAKSPAYCQLCGAT
jgi:hypothetical protein